MVKASVILEDESEMYVYGIQILIERVFAFALIFGLAVIMHRFLEVLLFITSFSIVRKYSGGIHCKRFIDCLMASVAVSFSGVVLFPFIEKVFLTYQGGGDNVNDNCYFNWRDQQPRHRLERLRI